MPTHEIARLKLRRPPEGRRIFIAHDVWKSADGAITADPATFRGHLRSACYTLFPRLKQRIRGRRTAARLSGGEQQMLAIARAVMARRACCCSTSRRSVLAPADRAADLRRHQNAQQNRTASPCSSSSRNAYHALKLGTAAMSWSMSDHAHRFRPRIASNGRRIKSPYSKAGGMSWDRFPPRLSHSRNSLRGRLLALFFCLSP